MRGGNVSGQQLIGPVPSGLPSFLESERVRTLEQVDGADIAVLGVPYGVPYDLAGMRSPSALAPAAIREASRRFVKYLGHYDFDLGGPLFADRKVRIVDCGDVFMQSGDFEGNAMRTEQVVRDIRSRGAVPIVLGGDHSIPIPVMRGCDSAGSMGVIQLDAHIDWRDEINGVTDGLSSQMRRASELEFVQGMAQFGIRGMGSARQEEVDAALTYGARLILAEQIHDQGVNAVLNQIPDCSNYYITFDADGLDPSIAPGVNSPAFGGLSYFQSVRLIEAVAKRGRIAGFDFVEVAPENDIGGMTSLIAARVLLFAIGALAHTGQIGR